MIPTEIFALMPPLRKSKNSAGIAIRILDAIEHRENIVEA